MTRERDELVDEFLADLGTAPVPHDLATTVGRRLRHEHPARASRLSPWLAAAATVAMLALGTYAWSVAGPGPSPTPTPSSAPSASPSTGSPTPAATAAPSAAGDWPITLNPVEPGAPHAPLALIVIDHSGSMVGVAQATSATRPAPAAPLALGIGPGADDRSITVAWTGGGCDERAQLELAADGRTLALRYPPGPGCDAVGIEFAVELRFARPADPASFAGSWGKNLVSVTDIKPRVVAFSDPQHGFVAGTTISGDAIILETSDGGATWRVEGLGSGAATDIGVAARDIAWAGRDCASGPDTCVAGLYRFDVDGIWGRAGLDWPTRLSFSGQDGAALFLAADTPVDGAGAPMPEVRLSNDGGETWTTVTSPCPATLRTQDVTRVDASTVVVVCESEGATGNASKALYRSTDAGRTWTKLADGPNSGTGTGLALRSDGTGWLWGARSPLLATRDGGRTWTDLGVADGNVRIVQDADAWGGGAGVVLVWDPDRQAMLLLRTADGSSWTELFAWPAVPSCCG